MVEVTNKAFRHPKVGRLYPGRPFQINDLQYPSNWLELASEGDLVAAGVKVSDDITVTPEDEAQEKAYQAQQHRRDVTTKEQFERLGRFVQAFEQMVDNARTACSFLITTDHKQSQLVKIALHNRSMRSAAAAPQHGQGRLMATVYQLPRNDGEMNLSDVASRLSAANPAACRLG